MDLPQTSREIRRSIELTPKDVGSRAVTADRFASLITALQANHGIKFENLAVRRFGHNDILYYPAEDAHKAIGDYDVKRIHGDGRKATTNFPDSLLVSIDLDARGWFSTPETIFRISGVKAEVDSAERTLQDHIGRWERTNNYLFHYDIVWGIAFVAIHSLGIWNGVTLLLFPELLHEWLSPWAIAFMSIFLFYAQGYIFFVLLKTPSHAPFIWFKKPGGLVERVQGRFFKYGLGMAVWVTGVIVAELVAKLLP